MSRIIKSTSPDQPVSTFNFRSIMRGETIAAAQAADVAVGFIPMALFDPSELKDPTFAVAAQQSSEQLPEIPGKFVSDEELHEQLQESYQRGIQDGKNLAERGLFNVFRSLRTAAEELDLLREKVLRDSEDDLLALVIAISRKIIQQEVSQDRMVVLKVIRAALSNLNDSDDVVIRLHPDDQALLTTTQDQALKKELAGVRFTLRSDPALAPGCCQVETALGTVDASFEAQLEEIYRRLVEERNNTEQQPDQIQDEE